MSKSNLSIGTKLWADKINAAWRASALMVATEVGQHLIDAKANVPHGDFERMVKQELDFGPQTARKLMAVARDTRIRDRAQGRALPDHWTTYYKLTQLSDEELDEAFESGVINSEMRRIDVPKPRKDSPQGDAVQAIGERVPDSRPEANREPPQTDAKGEDSAVIYSDEPEAEAFDSLFHADPAARFATALALAIAASRELSPREAAEAYPKDMLPPEGDVSWFTNWMLAFEEEIANAALQSAVAE